MRYLKNIYLFILALFESPLSAGILSMFVYATFAAQRGPINGTSTSPYFNYLADAFLHGQLAFRLTPSNLHDLALFKGHYYMYWPPFPAFLLMPFIAVFGVKFSDVFFTLVLGGINVGLLAYLLRLVDRQKIIELDANDRGLLTIFFAFGTVHLFLASLGNVWFTSQIVAFFGCLLTYLAAIRLKGFPAFFLTGLALTCTLLTRNHLIFLGIWPAIYLSLANQSQGWRKLLTYLAAAALPIVIGLVTFGVYNYLRFGNFTETGVAYQNLGDFFQGDYQKYGLLSLHYFATNFYYNFIFYPFPASDATLMGGSLFLLSPLFIAAFWTLFSAPLRKASAFLWLTVVVVAIPILLNIGTGWKTFGPRYTLDFSLPLLLLTAMGIHSWPKWVKTLLIGISIVQYIVGTLYFIKVT